MKGLMENAGFIDVVESTAIWPIGGWPKDKQLKQVGRWGLLGLSESLYPFSVALLTRGLGWSIDQVRELCRDTEKELPKGNYYAHG